MKLADFDFPDFEQRLKQFDTGNLQIDQLARQRAYQDVWVLLTRYPLVQQWELTLFDARRERVVEGLVQSDLFYAELKNSEFPNSLEAWQLLGICAIEACTGVRVAPEQLLDATAAVWGKAKTGSLGQRHYESIKSRYQ